MRTVFGAALGAVSCVSILLTGLSLAPPARADTTYYQNNAQFGMTLPQASLSSGQDEIRTADGTSCRSAVGGNGAYVDVGVIGTPGGDDIESSAAGYSRLVIPLGQQSERLDCTQLYNLEISRLKMELELARMGASGGAATPDATAASAGWDDDGWSSGPASGSTGAQITTPVSEAEKQELVPKPAKTKAVAAAAPAKAVVKPKVIPVAATPEPLAAKPKRKKQSLLGVMFPAPALPDADGLY